MLFEKLTKHKKPASQKSGRRIEPTATKGPQRKRRLRFSGGADSTGFDPLDLSDNSTCRFWLDASQITGVSNGADLTTGTGNSEWSDKSGAGVAVHAGTIQGNAPSYQTNIINGLPAILFDESNNEQVQINLSGGYFIEADYTIFMVIQPVDANAGSSNGQHLFGNYIDSDWTETNTLNGNRLSMGILQSDSKFIVQGSIPTNDRISSASALQDGKPYILTAAYDYSATTMWNWADNSSVVGLSATNSITDWVANVGGMGQGTVLIGGLAGSRGATNNDYDGYIAEIIVYSNLLSEKDLNLVKHYLADKYAIEVTNKTRY